MILKELKYKNKIYSVDLDTDKVYRINDIDFKTCMDYTKDDLYFVDIHGFTAKEFCEKRNLNKIQNNKTKNIKNNSIIKSKKYNKVKNNKIKNNKKYALNNSFVFDTKTVEGFLAYKSFKYKQQNIPVPEIKKEIDIIVLPYGLLEKEKYKKYSIFEISALSNFNYINVEFDNQKRKLKHPFMTICANRIIEELSRYTDAIFMYNDFDILLNLIENPNIKIHFFKVPKDLKDNYLTKIKESKYSNSNIIRTINKYFDLIEKRIMSLKNLDYLNLISINNIKYLSEVTDDVLKILNKGEI